MTRSPSALSSTVLATSPVWSCESRDRRVYSVWLRSTVTTIGTVETSTTSPSGQYIASSSPVTTTICRKLRIRKTRPNPRNRRIMLRSVMIRDSSWPDCQLLWKPIGSSCIWA